MSDVTAPFIPWEKTGEVIRQLAFYVLVAAAVLSYPLITVGDNAITLFDATLVLYLLVRLSRGGLTASLSWNAYWGVWALYIAYLLIAYLFKPGVFGGLLVAKHIEHVLFALVLVDHFESNRKNRDRDFGLLLVVITVGVLYQLAYYHRILGGIGETYRLGIPFAQGVSSNPAGLFLASWIVLLLHVPWFFTRHRLVSIVSLVLATYALVLTDSRTNILALLMVLTVSALVRVSQLRRGWLWLFLLFVLGSTGYVVFLQLPAPTGPLDRIAAILRDPLSVFEDGSFSVRLYETWPAAIERWLESPKNVFFGAGLSSFRIVDGTVPRLLANQGFVGLLLFLYVWFFHFLFRHPSKAVIMLLLLSLINGLNGETLIIVYRSVQVYLVMIVCAAVYSDRILPKETLNGLRTNAEA